MQASLKSQSAEVGSAAVAVAVGIAAGTVGGSRASGVLAAETLGAAGQGSLCTVAEGAAVAAVEACRWVGLASGNLYTAAATAAGQSLSAEARRGRAAAAAAAAAGLPYYQNPFHTVDRPDPGCRPPSRSLDSNTSRTTVRRRRRRSGEGGLSRNRSRRERGGALRLQSVVKTTTDIQASWILERPVGQEKLMMWFEQDQRLAIFFSFSGKGGFAGEWKTVGREMTKARSQQLPMRPAPSAPAPQSLPVLRTDY